MSVNNQKPVDEREAASLAAVRHDAISRTATADGAVVTGLVDSEGEAITPTDGQTRDQRNAAKASLQ